MNSQRGLQAGYKDPGCQRPWRWPHRDEPCFRAKCQEGTSTSTPAPKAGGLGWTCAPLKHFAGVVIRVQASQSQRSRLVNVICYNCDVVACQEGTPTSTPAPEAGGLGWTCTPLKHFCWGGLSGCKRASHKDPGLSMSVATIVMLLLVRKGLPLQLRHQRPAAWVGLAPL